MKADIINMNKKSVKKTAKACHSSLLAFLMWPFSFIRYTSISLLKSPVGLVRCLREVLGGCHKKRQGGKAEVRLLPRLDYYACGMLLD